VRVNAHRPGAVALENFAMIAATVCQKSLRCSPLWVCIDPPNCRACGPIFSPRRVTSNHREILPITVALVRMRVGGHL